MNKVQNIYITLDESGEKGYSDATNIDIDNIGIMAGIITENKDKHKYVFR